MRKIMLVAACALALGGCATFKNPWAGGHFDNAVWKADLAVLKDHIQRGNQAILDAADAICPEIPGAKAIASDPVNLVVASSYLGSQTAAQKASNNINAALDLLQDACNVRNTTTLRDRLIAGAGAINDAKRIFKKTP